uniref:Uncharacterized protein n=1 Tax=Panagrolaimus superbus TaxID=310955 RepID=A0A914YII6_9BILA
MIEMSLQLSSLKKFMLSCNSLGSNFDTLKRQYTNGIIDLGAESDDEGSASENDEENIEESESDEEQNGVSAGDDWDNDKEFLSSFVEKDFQHALDMLSIEEEKILSFANAQSKRWDTVEDGKRW